MGRQTAFFMSETDEHEFLHVIHDHGDVILDRYADVLTMEDVLGNDWPRQFHVAQTGTTAIVYRTDTLIGGRYRMDTMDSEVIELSLCHRGGNQIEEGRIWAPMDYWNADEQLVRKSKQFEDMYNYYHKWFRKHYRLENGKPRWYRIGPDAYRLYKEEGYEMKTVSVLAEFD